MEERIPRRSNPFARTQSISKPVTSSTPTPTASDYKHQYDQISNVIGDLNEKLTDRFHRRESAVLDEYKNELEALQRELLELKNNTGEEGLRRKLAARKEELERQRTQHLDLSTFFSGKCEVFKERVSKVLHQNKQLADEIRYLEEKVNEPVRQKKKKPKEGTNRRLPSETQQSVSAISHSFVSKPRLFSEAHTIKPNRRTNKFQESKDSQQISFTAEINSQTHNMSMQVAPEHNKSPANLGYTPQPSKKRLKAAKLAQILEDPLLKETEFEKLFLESVAKVKERKLSKGSKAITNLPQIRRTNEPPAEDQHTDSSTIHISDSDLNDFDKRIVVEDFLSREEVKEYFYALLFSREPEPPFMKNLPRPEVFDKPF